MGMSKTKQVLELSNNYSRFWSLMRKARYSGEEAEDMKRTMVLSAMPCSSR